MNYAEQQRQIRKHPTGLIVVAVGHVVLGYALVNGLGHKIVEVIKAPIETKIIEEVKPPPPPPPENLPPPPKVALPPPSFVPPPEIEVIPAPPQQPVIDRTRPTRLTNPIQTTVPVLDSPPVMDEGSEQAVAVDPGPPVEDSFEVGPPQLATLAYDVYPPPRYPRQALRNGDTVRSPFAVDFAVRGMGVAPAGATRHESRRYALGAGLASRLYYINFIFEQNL